MSEESSTRTVNGTCHHDCPDSCGWTVTVEHVVEKGVEHVVEPVTVEDVVEQAVGAGTPVSFLQRATKIRGNPAHPFSQGELCPKVNRFLERVYSPERVLRPMRRIGPKGSAIFAPITWDEALVEIGDRWKAIVDEFGAEAIAPFTSAGNQSLLALHTAGPFLARLGASRQVDSVCGATAGAGLGITYGSGRAADPVELRHAKCVVLWGTNTRLTNRHLWPFVEEARAKGAVIICIDPLKTITAESSDWHLQPLPGTDVALMLAVVHILIRDQHVDHEYVREHSVGFQELASEASAWSPSRVAAICGLSIDDIERFAATVASAAPAHFRTLIGAEHHEQGATFFRLLACLPVLLGSWRHRGGGVSRSVGVYTESMLGPVAPIERPEGPRPRSLSMNQIGRWLTDTTLAPPVKALLVVGANPLVTIPNADATRRGLERDDLFTVVHEQFITDTARYADIVLPATTQIESSDIVASWGSMHLNWNEAAIAPLGESVSNSELYRRLASAMGFDEPHLHLSDEEMFTNALSGKAADAGITLDSLKKSGVVRIVPEDFRPYADGGFATSSGKAELASPALVGSGLEAVPTFITAKESSFGEVSSVVRDFPLHLLTPKYHTRFLNSSYAHLPNHGGREGEPFVELTAVDAADREVVEGDMVDVFNDRASLRLRARIGDTARPGVVVVPFGWNAESHVDGKTANALTNDTIVNWGGGVSYSDTVVQIRKVW